MSEKAPVGRTHNWPTVQVGVGVAVADFYQVSYGSKDIVTRSVTVAAKEGTNILHTIRQYEIWETGEVLIVAGNVNEKISYRFRKDFSIETLPPANIGCPGQGAPPPQVQEGPTTTSSEEGASQLQPTAIPQPGVQPSSPPIQLAVWATEENGVVFTAERTGRYQIKYVGDAYSSWPSDQADGYRGWTTILRLYVNRPVEWGTTEYGLPGPVNHDHYLTPGEYYLDKNAAIASANGDSRQIKLAAGEYITFVVLDESGRYFDNQGKVDVSISFIGE